MINETAKVILEKRYVRKDADGKPIETPEEVLHRVAKAVAEPEGPDAEIYYEHFYNLMASMDFLPNSPTLMNAGTEEGQLSACFVLPIEDSMEGIFGTLRDAALIHKTGGGTGFSFSRLRPADSVVRSTGGVASGPISFLHAYNAATETVKQGGKRRGANMGVLRVDHPNVLDFIGAKSDTSVLTNFNLSVGITDAFMQALTGGNFYDLIDPKSKKVVGQLNAKEVWDLIITAAHATGEPGVIYLDTVNKFNPTPELGEFEATNPCGEQPLLPYESCNLGSINLKNFVKNGAVDTIRLGKVVRTAVRFLDNVITVNKYPLPSIAEATLHTRKIGLGVMGWADMLLVLGVPYNSDEGRDLAQRIMKLIDSTAKDESEKLAEERGHYPAWKPEHCETPRRHAALTTIAPTGTISMIAGVSSGIEPNFSFAYTKTVMDNDSFVVVNDILVDTLKKEKIYSHDIVQELGKTGRMPKSLPKHIRDIFVSSHDITPEDHVLMQAAFQRYTDNAISKTINFLKHATIQDFDVTYRLAYEMGCKGITAYRDGSRDSQVLNLGTGVPTVQDKLTPVDRPKTLYGITEKVKTGCGNLYVTINSDTDDNIREVMLANGKNGGCKAQSEALSLMATCLLRSNVEPDAIVKQLLGVKCPAATRNKNSECQSCPDAVARVLKGAMEKTASKAVNEDEPERCPDCGAAIENTEGCKKCPNPMCGYSKCN